MAYDKNAKGEWKTIKGTHVFIPEGSRLSQVLKSKKWSLKGSRKEKDRIDKKIDENWKPIGDKLDKKRANSYERLQKKYKNNLDSYEYRDAETKTRNRLWKERMKLRGESFNAPQERNWDDYYRGRQQYETKGLQNVLPQRTAPKGELSGAEATNALNKLEVGMPVMVKYGKDFEPKQAIYMGRNEGRFAFYDGGGVTGRFDFGEQFLKDNPNITFDFENNDPVEWNRLSQELQGNNKEDELKSDYMKIPQAERSNFYDKLDDAGKEKYDNYLKQGYSESDIENTLMYKTHEEQMREKGLYGQDSPEEKAPEKINKESKQSDDYANETDPETRLKNVYMMDRVLRGMNNEDALDDGWLMNGVADGDTDDGWEAFKENNVGWGDGYGYYVDDETYNDLVKMYQRRVNKYAKDGVLTRDYFKDTKGNWKTLAGLNDEELEFLKKDIPDVKVIGGKNNQSEIKEVSKKPDGWGINENGKRTTKQINDEYNELSQKMQQDDYYYKPEDDRKLKQLRAEYDTEVARGQEDVNLTAYNDGKYNGLSESEQEEYDTQRDTNHSGHKGVDQTYGMSPEEWRRVEKEHQAKLKNISEKEKTSIDDTYKKYLNKEINLMQYNEEREKIHEEWQREWNKELALRYPDMMEEALEQHDYPESVINSIKEGIKSSRYRKTGNESSKPRRATKVEAESLFHKGGTKLKGDIQKEYGLKDVRNEFAVYQFMRGEQTITDLKDQLNRGGESKETINSIIQKRKDLRSKINKQFSKKKK